MRHSLIVVALVCAFTVCALGQQSRSFDWVRASDEAAVLDPAAFHAGRVYRPGYDGGNLHVDIDAALPVTIAMTPEPAWIDAQQHPETIRNLTFSCMREHVVSTHMSVICRRQRQWCSSSEMSAHPAA